MENWNFKNGILNKFGILEVLEILKMESKKINLEFWKF